MNRNVSAYSSQGIAVLRKIILVLLHAVLVTPLLLSSKFFFPFITTKTLFFRFVVELILVAYILLAVADKRFRPRWNWMSGIVSVYLGIIFVTSLIGINFYRSFWGNVERGEGILTFLHVVAFFFVLSVMLTSERQWRRFFTFSVLVSLIGAGYATLQKLGFSSIGPFNIVPGDTSRISGTIGNAAFFAGYLVPHVFLAIWLALQYEKPWLKGLLGLAAGYLTFMIFLTQTRGAMLAIIIGITLALIFMVFASKRRRVRQWGLAALVILVFLGGIIWSFRDSEFVSQNRALHRLTNIKLDDVTVESRLLTWQASWRGLRDRFFSGYGYENFNIAFNKYFPAKIFRDAGSQIWFDRAHNIIFDVALTSGIFGLVVYLGIFLVGLGILWKYFRQRLFSDYKVTTGLFAVLLISYFIQNLFVFDTLGTYITFYSVLAFLVFLSQRKPAPSAPKIIRRQSFEQQMAPALNPYLAATLVIILFAASYLAVIRPAQANVGVTRALFAMAQGRFKDTVESYKKVLAMGTYVNEEAAQKLAEAMLRMRASEEVSLEVKKRSFRFAIEEMQKVINRAPRDVRNYVFLMALYNNFPNQEAGPREEVIRLGKKALKLSPTRPQIYFEMGRAAHTLGRFEEGIGYFEKALELNPEPVESHWNLAMAYILGGRPEDGEREIDYLFRENRIHLVSDFNLQNLIQIYNSLNNRGSAVRIYKELVRRNPQNKKLWQGLAEVYRDLCQQQEAQSAILKVVELDPSFSDDSQKFISQMSQQCEGGE